MSNSSDSSDQNNSSNKSLRWSFIQNDLSHALNAWQELEQKQTNLSPDEEQMVKIKSIIGQLRQKLEQF